MKNISYLKICQQVLLIGLVFTIASCGDKFFDEQAGSRITPDQHYKSETDALVSLEGAVMPLQNVLPKLIMVDGLRSDQMDVNPNAEVFLKDINNQVLTIDNPFDKQLHYKATMNLMKNKKWVNTSVYPVMPKLKSIEMWPDIITSLALVSFELKDK